MYSRYLLEFWVRLFVSLLSIHTFPKRPDFIHRFDALSMTALALFIAAVGFSPAFAFNDTCYGPPYQGGGPEGHVFSGHTPCKPSTDDSVARACCSYSGGSICLSNGLCFVPQNNTMLQGSCTDPSWTSPGCPETKCVGIWPHLRVYTSMDVNSTLDANLIMCETTSGDVPADGDSGGLWYCGTPTQSCADATATFGIQQGYLADFRNYSSTSHAVITSTMTVPAISSARVTSDAGSNAAATTGTQHTLEPSCSPHTGDLSGGAIAGVAIGSFCVGLIVSGVGIFVFRRRGGGKHEVVQTAMEGKDNTQQHWEGRSGIVEMSSADDRVRELPAGRLRGAELQ